MASHAFNYEPFPDVNPSGGPEAQQTIHADPDMFGAAIGRGLQGLGQGLEKTSSEGFDVATMVAHQDANSHANELNAWFAKGATDATEKFVSLRGKAAEMELPNYQKTIDDLRTQALGQAGNPYTKQLVDNNTRQITDSSYRAAARHAGEQKATWDFNSANEKAESYGSLASLHASTIPSDALIQANPNVALYLSSSDAAARDAANLKGLDGDIEAQKNRGRNVERIVKAMVADGSQTSLQRAWSFVGSQDAKIDGASRATIETALRGQTAQYNGQFRADAYMGRGPSVPPGYIGRTFQLESGGNPAAVSGSHAGLGQFSPAMEKRYGINDTNRDDPAAQARALQMENAENRPALMKALGHEPTPADYYLAHQQGIGGAVAHISQPNLPAWQNMAATGEGHEKGSAWAKQAVWGNMTPEMRAQFPGGVSTVTSGDFAHMWAQRFYGQSVQQTPQDFFRRNQEFVKPGTPQFSTTLNEPDEAAFRKWVTENKVPFDPNAKGPQDYDMRGFWKGLQSGDEHAKSAVDPNDGKLHYPDYWKTPYHETFSNESQWANEKAPHWTDDDKLVTPDGRVLFDDRKQPAPSQEYSAIPAAMGTFNRPAMAQEFNEQNKGDVLRKIQNDPFLIDHPQAMQAALTHANKIFEANSASYADMERNQRVVEQQRKLISEDAENNYLKQIYAPPANAKPLNTADIVNDDRLNPATKDRLIKLIKDPGEKDEKTYGPGFVKAFQMVHAPEGTEGRITDVNQLYPRLGPDGDLTMAGIEKLRGEIDLRKSPEGTAESEMRKAFLANAKAKITGSDEGLHIKDPKGDELYLQFMAQALPRYDAGRKAGKSPSQLLDPTSSDYVGKGLIDQPGHGFRRPMDQWFNDTIHDQPATNAAGTKPPFDIASVKSLDDLVAAFRAGNVTKVQADEMAINNGWAKRKPVAEAVPVSQ